MSTAAKAEKKRLISLNTRNTLVGLSFILPNFIGFTVFILVPVIFFFVLSVMKWDGFTAMEFVGLQNFVNIFKDRVFRAALRQTIVFSVFTVIFSMIAALGLALLLNTKIKFVNFFRSAIFFPYVASIVAVGAVFKAMFLKDGGPINQFLSMIGVPAELLPGWLSSTKWALMAVIIVQVWKNMGYFMLIYLAALQDIPSSLYEAARIDGLSEYGCYFRIVLPLAKPAIATLTIFTFVNTWNDFMGPMIYFNSEANKTIPLGIRMFIGQYSSEYQLIMAASVVALLPILILYVFCQRFFVQGIATIGLKG